MTVKVGDECIFFSPIRDWDDFICIVETIDGPTAVVKDLMHSEKYEVPVAALAHYPFVGMPFGMLVEEGDSIDKVTVQEDCLLIQPWGELDKEQGS